MMLRWRAARRWPSGPEVKFRQFSYWVVPDNTIKHQQKGVTKIPPSSCGLFFAFFPLPVRHNCEAMASPRWAEKALPPDCENETQAQSLVTDEQLCQLREAARLSNSTPLREIVFDSAPAWLPGVGLEGVYVPDSLSLEQRSEYIERKRREEDEWAEMAETVAVLETELQSWQKGEPTTRRPRESSVGLVVIEALAPEGDGRSTPARAQPRVLRPSTASPRLQRHGNAHVTRPPLE